MAWTQLRSVARFRRIRARRPKGARRRSIFYLDMRGTKVVTPAAALLFASELDRWNKSNPHRRMVARDVDQWDPEVRNHLSQLGFFKLLRVPGYDVGKRDSDVVFMPFRSGVVVDGKSVKRLQKAIAALAGDVSQPNRLYDGLIEAVTNVVNHAYSRKARHRRWWMSASFDRTRRRLTVMVLDHGRGIPLTLPRVTKRELWNDALTEFLGAVGVTVHDDAAMIEAAVTLERSSTGLINRGLGLKENIQAYIEQNQCPGRLRIMSNRGEYQFHNDGNRRASTSRRNRGRSLHGTFVEWSIEVPSRQQQ